MDRTAAVSVGLRDHLNDDIELIQVDDVEWLARHPSGFGRISPAVEGDFFEYNPGLIAETAAVLTDDDYELYLNSISEWWLFSTVRYSEGLTGEEALETYLQHAPDSAVTLAVVADLNGCDLTTWLNAR